MITVNQVKIPVTANLHAALLRLKAEKIDLVWVDAICINQQDDEEKSIQVGRMASIFKKAEQVVVWLGDANDLEEDDLKALAHRTAGESRETLPISPQRTFARLLSRPYWARVWIIQELAAASDIIVLCGTHKLSWEVFSDVAITPKAGVSEIEIEDLSRRLQSLHQFRTDKLSGTAINFLDALYRSRSALSTNPRDKLYALLGLAYDSEIFIPEPNYGLSVEQIFIDFAKMLVRKGLPLDFIYLRSSHRRVPNSLPSWVVDWSELDDVLAKQEFEYMIQCCQQSNILIDWRDI